MTTTNTESLRKPTKAEGWRNAAASSEQADRERANPPRRFSGMLPVRLTEAEIGERARHAAVARRRVAEFEAELKAAQDQWRLRIKTAKAERDSLLDIIESGAEDRAVECVESFDWRLGVVRVTRVDTGATLSERAMTSLERQLTLPGVPAACDLESTPAVHDGDEPEGRFVTPEEEESVLDEMSMSAAAPSDAYLDELDAMLGAEITMPDVVLGAEPPPNSPKAKRRARAKRS